MNDNALKLADLSLWDTYDLVFSRDDTSAPGTAREDVLNVIKELIDQSYELEAGRISKSDLGCLIGQAYVLIFTLGAALDITPSDLEDGMNKFIAEGGKEG